MRLGTREETRGYFRANKVFVEGKMGTNARDPGLEMMWLQIRVEEQEIVYCSIEFSASIL